MKAMKKAKKLNQPKKRRAAARPRPELNEAREPAARLDPGQTRSRDDA
jgi:hypothetical protein